MRISELQGALHRTYFDRDSARGADATFRWMVEEVGELAQALRQGDGASLKHEFGDVLAWLTSLASLVGVDLDEAASRYAQGCPKCGSSPCRCPLR